MGKGQFSPVEKKKERNRQSGEGENSEDSKEDDEFVAPPDGGWGWVVVFSSFIIHVVADGIVYSFGVFLMEFVDYFKAGRGAVSWIGALQPAVTYSVGPLSSALTNRYGCRIVTIVGAIIAAIGFIISLWAPNLYYLYVTSGVMAGIGFGLIYLPAIVCVAQYFEKRRSFATGLAVCGSGFGTFILAPLTKLLVEEYSWRGAMLILGGLILNIVVCGITFRPLEPTVKPQRKSSVEPEETALLGIGDIDESEGTKNGNIVTLEAVEIIMKNSATGGKESDEKRVMTDTERMNIVNSLQKLNAIPNGTTLLMKDGHSGNDHQIVSMSLKSMDLARSGTLPEGVEEVTLGDSGKGKPSISASQCLTAVEPYLNTANLALSDSALFQQPTSPNGTTTTNPRPRKRIHLTSESSHASSTGLAPLQRKDIFYSGSLQNIPMYKSQPDVYKAAVTVVQDSRVTSEKGEKKSACFDFSEEFRATMKDMLSVELLKNPVFLMFAFSNFFTSIGFNMPFIFLPDRAQLAGVDEDKAALLLSVIGIANTAGRVIFGFLSDRSWVNRLFLYSTALTICGIATALCPIVGGNYILLVAYAAIFGVFIGVYVSLTSIVLVDLLGLEYLTNSFGLLLLFQGAATFVGPPIAGWLYDWTGSYDISFILMGILIAISGAMLYLLPLVQRSYERRMPKDKIVHDIQLGKLSAKEDGADLISI